MRSSKLRPGAQTEIGRVFHALGDPTRRALLDRLAAGPVSISELAAPLSITLTAVSQHLRILELSGLAQTEKVGRVRTCRIHAAGLDALDVWIRHHRTTAESRADRMVGFPQENEDEEPEQEPFLG
jgi:DNA-binding transcriptional ArsR family regulator